VSAPPARPHTVHDSWPLYWFALLESALETGDLAQAADAQRRLKQLGIRVELLPPWEGEEVADAC
jgi:hypothetical protein